MTVMEREYSLEANGARTSDWIGQIKDGILYAYDLSLLESEKESMSVYTKADFERDLKKVSRKIKK
jgi:hypothetical protein